MRDLQAAGYEALGLDGNPNTPSWCPGGLVRDLALPVEGVDPAPCVMSLEVSPDPPRVHAAYTAPTPPPRRIDRTETVGQVGGPFQ